MICGKKTVASVVAQLKRMSGDLQEVAKIQTAVVTAQDKVIATAAVSKSVAENEIDHANRIKSKIDDWIA